MKEKVNSKKKAKPRTIRNVTKIILGKKVADKMKDNNKDKILEEEELSEKKIKEKKLQTKLKKLQTKYMY